MNRKKLALLVVAGLAVIFAFLVDQKKLSEPQLSTAFTNEQIVAIIGYAGDAMEPSISRDGQYLFWNSLNDAISTGVYYAKRIDDANFQFVGEVANVNGVPPRLDAVASMDSDGNFYWVSLRNYPDIFENYQRGKFSDGTVTDIAPVKGDFYKRSPGWLIMDAEVSSDGELLFFVNAKFEGGVLPVESIIGFARRVNGEFIRDANSDQLLRNINTEKHLEYAPSLSADGMELFFTRARGTGIFMKTHIYSSRRNSLTEAFGKPEPIDIRGNGIEGPSISSDGRTLYYHKKDGQHFRIFKMTRDR